MKDVALSLGEINGDGKALAIKLGIEGLIVDSVMQLQALLRVWQSPRVINHVTQPGFHKTDKSLIFVTPIGEVINGDADAVQLLPAGRANTAESKGTLDDWKREITARVHRLKVPYWKFGLVSALNGSLIDLIGGQSRGANISGPTSVGKSITLFIASSVWTTSDHGEGVCITRARPITVSRLHSRERQRDAHRG